MKFLPRKDHTLLKMDPPKEVTEAGIIITARPGEDFTESGVSVAQGPNGWEVGVRVIINKHGGTPVFLDGNEYRCVPNEQVLGAVVE